MARTYTTVTDVVEHLLTVQPDLLELGEERLAEIVREARVSRYEEIDADEFDAIYTAAWHAMMEGSAASEPSVSTARYAFMRHEPSGEVYGVWFRTPESDEAAGVCGPLHHSEVHAELLAELDYLNADQSEDVQWFNANRDAFRPVETAEV